MPTLRVTRDKRGYENTYLMHAVRRRGKKRSLILYWFRTPPNVKIGRAPLDEEAARAIQALHPDLEFDWPKLLEAQPPPTVTPPRREAARQARRGRPGASSNLPRVPEPQLGRVSEEDAATAADEPTSLGSAAVVTTDPVSESTSGQPAGRPEGNGRRRRRSRRGGARRGRGRRTHAAGRPAPEAGAEAKPTMTVNGSADDHPAKLDKPAENS